MVTPGVEPEVDTEATTLIGVMPEEVIESQYLSHIVVYVWSQHILQMNVIHIQIVKLKERNYWNVMYVKTAQDKNMRENANSKLYVIIAKEHTSLICVQV